ncbi:MAG: DUF58 domain-containing protein [Planctomycetaceae bacterium]
MSDRRPQTSVRTSRSMSLGAGALTQLLAAFASFLAAWVLPMQYPELTGLSQKLLIGLGILLLLMGTVNVLYGRRIAQVMHRFGRRSRVVVPREGMAYLGIMLVLAVGALLGQRNMPLLLFGMMAGPFIVNGWIVYGMLDGISLRRHAPRRASVGEFVSVELEVHNGKKLLTSRMLDVRDRIEAVPAVRGVPEQEGSVTFVQVPAGEHRTGRYQVRFANRGRYRLGPIRVSSQFPLGIGERGQGLADTADLIVHPEIGRLRPAWNRRKKELTESSRRQRAQLGLFDDEFHRIREFRPNDNPRSVHWRSTARRGQLMVREFEQHRQADSLILLDLPGLADWSTNASEKAICLAATICVEQTITSSGSNYVLAIAGRSVELISSRSPAGFREAALDALAVCHRSKSADIAKALRQISETHHRSDETLLIITPRRDFIEQLLQAMNEDPDSGISRLVSRTAIVSAAPGDLDELLELPDREVSA